VTARSGVAIGEIVEVEGEVEGVVNVEVEEVVNVAEGRGLILGKL